MVQSRLFVSFVTGIGVVLLRCVEWCRVRGRRSTLVVIFDALVSFLTGAVNRDFSTCGSFSEIGGSLARKLCFGILMLSLQEAFLRQNALAGLRYVNLEVQISWQAQHFVTSKAQQSVLSEASTARSL